MQLNIPLTQIDDNPFQRRQEYGDIANLAADIYRHNLARPDTKGLQQVPNGRLIADDGYPVPIANMEPDDLFDKDGNLLTLYRVQLEFGHRRKRAFAYLAKQNPQYHTMPIILRDLEDDDMLDGVWSENRQRRNLSAVEEAELLAIKLEKSASQREVAEAWGLKRPTVSNRLRLLSLPAAIQDANRQALLSERQCLSLATIAALPDLVDKNTKWGSATTAHAWETPAAPDAYIQHIIENPTTTSDTIRDVTNRMLAHVGHTLPKPIAQFSAAADIDAIRQPLCKGCPRRVNNHCLAAHCLSAKTDAFIDATLAAVAKELDLPISRDNSHFQPYDSYQNRQLLQAYYDAGYRENLVVGWKRGDGVRPFYNNSYIYDGNLFEENGRSAIVIGHTTGNIPAIEEDGENKPDDIADHATQTVWEKRAKALLQQARKTAKAALGEALNDSLNDYTPIMALAQKPNVETTDDASVLNKALLEFLWKRGLWMQWAPNTAVEEIQQISAMLKGAGINPTILQDPDPAANLSQQAVLWLNCWYYYRRQHYLDEKQQTIQTAIDALRTQFQQTTPLGADLLDLSHELDRAARDSEKSE